MIFIRSTGQRKDAIIRDRFLSRFQLEMLVVAVATLLLSFPVPVAQAFLPSTISNLKHQYLLPRSMSAASTKDDEVAESSKKKVVIIGAGWGGLSAAHALSSQTKVPMDITVVDASPNVGGLVRDGFQTLNGVVNKAEAGQHGFWDNYHNIFRLLDKDLPKVDPEEVLTGYAEQGQYSPEGLEAIWPVYRQQSPQLPTGLAQALYTRFEKLPAIDRATAAPLVLAFSEFDDSPEAWEKYDSVSFRDLCIRLGVSRRCYEEAFEVSSSCMCLVLPLICFII